MFPTDFEFTIDEGTNIYTAELDLIGDEYKYLIAGPNAYCHYTQEEVQSFVRISRWRIIT